MSIFKQRKFLKYYLLRVQFFITKNTHDVKDPSTFLCRNCVRRHIKKHIVVKPIHSSLRLRVDSKSLLDIFDIIHFIQIVFDKYIVVT